LKNDANVVARTADRGQGPGDQRPSAGTSGKRPGTSGALFGISGEERQGIWRAWLLGACLISCIAVVNVLTIRHDAPRLGTLPPAIWEGSSALVTLVIFALPAGVALWIMRTKPRWWLANSAARRFAAEHGLASTGGSDAHKAGHVGLAFTEMEEFTTPSGFLDSLPGAVPGGRRYSPWSSQLDRWRARARREKP